MPRYKITAPDGKVYFVTGDGTPEEALTSFKEQWGATHGGAGAQIPTTGNAQGGPDSTDGAAGATGALATVVGPDGRVMRTNKPLTPAEVEQAALQSQEGQGFLDRNIASFQSGVTQAGQGIKQFFGGHVPEEDVARERGISGAGTTGNVLANIAMLAGPGGKEAAAWRAVTKTVPLLGRTLAKLAIPASGAAEAALINPVLEGSETKGGAAVEGAVGATAGNALVKTLGRVATGIGLPNLTHSAKRILAELGPDGEPVVVPSVKAATEGAATAPIRFAQSFKQLLSKRPDVGRADAEVLDQISKEINPMGSAPIVGRIGREGWAKDMQGEFNHAYDEALKGKHVPFDLNDIANMKNLAQHEVMGTAANGYMGQITKRVDEAVLDANKAVAAGKLEQQGSAQYWQHIRTYLKEAKRTSLEGKQGLDAEPIAKAYDSMIDHMNTKGQAWLSQEAFQAPYSATSNAWDRLEEIGKKNLNFQLAKRMAADAKVSDTVRLPQAIKAVEAATPDNIKLDSTGAFQKWTDPMKDLSAREYGNIAIPARRAAYTALTAGLGAGGLASPLGVATVPLAAGLYGLGHLADTRSGAKFILGQNKWQKAVADKLREYPSLYDGVGIAAGASTEQRD